MSEPFDVRLIADRLRASVDALRFVGLAADYAAVTSLQDFPVPAAFVILTGERGTPNPAGQAPRGRQIAVRQQAIATFGVIVAARNYREQRGEQLADDLRLLVGACRKAVVGFVPDIEGARACQFTRGDLIDYSAGRALWADVFETQTFIGSA